MAANRPRPRLDGLFTPPFYQLASASPAAYSMLSDYYHPKLRATVLAIYSSGVYIGGGIGAASVQWSSFNVIGTASDGSIVSAPVLQTEDSIHLIGNVQLGASKKLSKNLKLDMGYRLTALSGDSFGDTGQPINTRESHDSGAFLSHEIRLGFRYEIW